MVDSLLYWADKSAAVQGMANFKLPGNLSIGWKGIRGMRWGYYHHNLQREFFYLSDGVHLSDVGLEIFLDNIRECLLNISS
jgi:hypothetical protein